MVMLAMRGTAAALVVLMSASPLEHPNGKLLRASRNGSVRVIRDVILETPMEFLDLDAALSVAASRGQMNAVAMLVEFGAADLNRALVSAARWNHCGVIRWLTDDERGAPADAYDLAREAASATDSCDAEWLLLAIMRYEERKRKNDERGV